MTGIFSEQEVQAVPQAAKVATAVPIQEQPKKCPLTRAA